MTTASLDAIPGGGAPAPPAPRQARSRATERRLLQATLELLDEAGLDGALIPRIAERAGVAPASVYRRFANKDALLRAAFLYALRLSNESNRATGEAGLLRGSLAASARRLVALLFAQYRQRPQLIRALSRFIDNDTDIAFVREARSIMKANGQLVVELLLRHREQIGHRQPRRALPIAVLSVACAIESFMLDPNSLWHLEPAIAEKELARELTRQLLAYLRG